MKKPQSQKLTFLKLLCLSPHYAWNKALVWRRKSIATPTKITILIFINSENPVDAVLSYDRRTRGRELELFLIVIGEEITEVLRAQTFIFLRSAKNTGSR